MKRKVLSGLLALTMVLAATGCSGGGSQSKEILTEKDEPQKVLSESKKFCGGEKLWGSEWTTEYYYTDGSVEEETATYIKDNEKNISQHIRKSGEGTRIRFQEETDEGTYVYIQEKEGAEWIRYKEEPLDDEDKEDEDSEDEGQVFDEDAYENIQYSNEGEEKLNGTDTVKIKATAVWKSPDTEEPLNEVLTREQVISDYGWTEEAIAAVDGFSELLDNYIETHNEAYASNTGSGDMEEEYLTWVDVNTHQPIQTQQTTILNNEDMNALYEAADAAMAAMDDASWEVYWIISDMEQGISLDESKQMIEEQRAETEAQIQADRAEIKEEEAAADESDDFKTQSKVVSTERFLMGKDCPKLGDLPKEYKEITQEQYFNGDY